MGFWFVVCSGVANPAPVTCIRKKRNNRKNKFWDLAINVCKFTSSDQNLNNIFNINRRSHYY